MFTLNSDIAIGGFRFTGVNGVAISHGIHGTVATAVITLPAVATVLKNGTAPDERIVTGGKFKEGDPVTIKLGYNGVLEEEFRGFVKSRSLGMPLEVTCEGYSWLLRRNKVNFSATDITLETYLNNAVAGIDPKYAITVVCPLSLTLANVQVNGNGMDALAQLATYTDGALTCFFVKPDVLWCGLPYTALAKGNDVYSNGAVKYRPGYNIPNDNTLKQRAATDDPATVRYSKKKADGALLTAASMPYKNAPRTHSRTLNQMQTAPALQALADEKALRLSYTGFEGSVTTFLQPYATPGCLAYIQDARYPARNGHYLVESVATTFGQKGARRVVEIGPLRAEGKAGR